MKRAFIRTLIGIAFVGGLFAAAQPVAATSVSCSTSALSTAITTANNTAGTDTLDLTANCTYSFTAAGSTDSTNGDSALPKITSTIIINGNGATIKRNATANFRLIYVSDGASLTLKNATVTGGTVLQPGAGIYNGTGSLALINTTLSGHLSITGGDAIYNNGGTLTVINTIVAGNGAGGTGGGALYNASGTATVINSTFGGNNSTAINRNSGTVTLKNSIVWGNLAQISGSVAATYSIVEGGASGTGNLNRNPLFVTQVAYASAPTTSGDYHLQAGSPADDAGSSAALPTDAYDIDGDGNTAETLPYDRDSQARVQYSLVDMGADEADYCSGIAFPYTATSATGLGVAIACANANATSDTINLTASTYSFSEANSVNSDSALPRIASDITINGNGATIQRSGASTSFRLVYITSGALSLNNLTVSGGSTGGSSGGGIYNSGGTLTIASSTVANNSSGTSIGGGIHNTGTLKITNSTISGNSANTGGGVFNWSGTATISNSTISGNTASNSGGGVFNNGTGGTLTVVNSTIAGNVATLYGAGVRNSSNASLTLVNTTIAGNASSGSEGAIINDNNGSLTMQNSTVAGNSDVSGSGSVGNSGGTFTIANSIIWNNSRGLGGTVSVSYSIVAGGASGTGNLSSDPLFVSAQAPSSAPTTGGDYHLQAGSPAADAGSSAALPADSADLDGDSDTSETLPYDRDSQARVLYETVDIGADEVDYCSAYAFPYTVPAADSAALKKALYCANANATADTINLTASTYSFGTADSANSDSALPRITSDITINGNGATIQRSGASASFRLAYIASGALILNNLTVSGGSTGGSFGGGIYNNGGTLTIANSTVANNSSSIYGGGIYSNGGTLTIANSTVANNSSGTSLGGGIHNNLGTLNIINSTISGNSANAGSGVYSWSGTATISDSTISGNTASNSGGGILNNGPGGTLTVVNSTIAGNVATLYGAGVRNSSSASLTLVNTTIAGNASSGSYGAILNDNSGSVTMQNSTVAGNSDVSGSGSIANSGGTFTIANSIMWNNSRGLGGAFSVSYSIVAGGYAGTGNLSSDPLFVSALAPSSAPTTSGDYHLQAGSPAADAGSSAALPADTADLDGDSDTAETLPYDRDNQARVQYETVDIGADEVDYCSAYAFPYTVPAADSAALKKALYCANANATSDTINLTNSTYSFSAADSANPDNALPIITSQVTINGNGAVIERASAATADFRLIELAATGHLTLDSATIRNGKTAGNGGGIYNENGTLTVTASTFDSNSANIGGGLAHWDTGVGTITDSVFSNNTASDQGGGLVNDGQLTITGSTFTGNTSEGYGGGLTNWDDALAIIDSTFTGNTAATGGGGVDTLAMLTIVNSTISGNTSDNYGGGFNSYYGNATIINSLITGNKAHSTHSGGIFNDRGTLTLINSTIAGNNAPADGAIRTFNGATTLTNSIVWGNSSAITHSGSGSTSATYSLIEGGYAGVGNLSGDPLFAGPVDDSAAPTAGGDYHLQAGSPARDTGSSAALPADTYDLDGDSDTGETLPYDLDGAARVSGTAVDMGAYEARFAAVVSITRSSPISATTTAASVTFQVVFDRALAGIDASDLAATVVSGNLSGASVTAVSGSAATYSVTVGTGSGSGVLRLDVLATARATDSAGLPIGLPAYAGGESYTIDRDAPGAPDISGIITDAGGQASGSTTDPTISLSGTAEPASTVALNRLGVGVIGTATADVSGGWVFDYTATPLALGTHVFTATAADAAGHISPSSDPFTVTVRTGTVWYVDHDATGANTGASWADAFTSLQAALAVGNAGDQLWVAAGSYKPGATGDRDATFALRTGLAVYGGFAGSETALAQRDWTTNVVTLTGDLNGDDGVNFANNGENSYHVVTGAAAATLDGFTIVGGNAGSGNGGGIYASGGSLTLSNVIVAGNTAAYGGGLYGSQISATLANVTFSNNAASNGGGMYSLDSSLALTAATFSGNSATVSGGGLVSRAGSAVLDGVTFSGNSAGGGGGLFSFQSALTLTDMIFSGNSATYGGGLNINAGSSALLTGATFTGNTATSTGGGFYTVSTAVLTGTSFANNTSESGGAIYSGSAGTVRLFASTLSGNSAIVGGGIFNRGRNTIVDTIFSGNSATYGGAAINLAGATSALTLTGSLLSDNIAAGDEGFGAGGGIQIAAGTATVSNTTFSGNQANGAQDDGGGAIMVYAGGLSLSNVTIAGNSTTSSGSGGASGGGISIDGSTAVVTLTNTIVAENAAAMGRPDLSGAFVSGGHNLIGDASGGTGFTNGLGGDQVGTSAAPLDPLLSALGGYGGAATAVTQTLALLPGSPAIDAGDSAACPAADQRGVARSQGGGCDIGAFESRGFTLGIAGGNNQVTTLGSAFALPLAVQVTANAAGEPVGPGGSVTWSGPASGAGLSTPVITGATALGGGASISVAANSTAGSYAVTATARGATAVTFNLQQSASSSMLFLPIILR